MTAMPSTVVPASRNRTRDHSAKSSKALNPMLDNALQEVHSLVPPLWPLADYVAVNPFFGMADKPFLKASQVLKEIRDCDLLMTKEYFHKACLEGKISPQDVASALDQCRGEYSDWYQGLESQHIMDWLEDKDTSGQRSDSRILTVAEAIDQKEGTSWLSHIVNDITRHCATHYDEGQALWPSPWKNQKLYSAWKEASQISARLDLLGLKGFRSLVRELPLDPVHALAELLDKLQISSRHWTRFLLAQVFSVPGWASFVRCKVRDAEMSGKPCDDLTGFLAMRLAYDVALANQQKHPSHSPIFNIDSLEKKSVNNHTRPGLDNLGRYLFQVAAEHAYRRKLLKEIPNNSNCQTIHPQSRKKLQMVFCIDVRSEVFRRNLESLDGSIETFGFAGFFGIPLEHFPLGAKQGVAQCPVLLKPSVQVHDGVIGHKGQSSSKAIDRKILGRKTKELWKFFKNSASTCFTFVESLGLGYIGKLFFDSSPRPLEGSGQKEGKGPGKSDSFCGPDIQSTFNQGLELESRVNLAENLLKNLGLTSNFGQWVVLCGHSSAVTNNPYRAALDCGACGGHSGEPNARVAAALLNQKEVRNALKSRGVNIPEDTWFLPAVHETSTDRVNLLDTHMIPGNSDKALAEIKSWLLESGKLTRAERATRFESTNPQDSFRRSNDWSEVRPEWGLAGNAAFIIGPRSLTAGLKLDGRTFLHNYDHKKDPELKVLELIMTAPMVVTNWINLQYYASSVDPVAFGSGNKVLHNVVGKFGILQGNGGDLMTGLPWQCVHDGKKLQHEPLRLTVLIAAPRQSIRSILNKHAMVANLVTNGWITLLALDENRFYRWTSQKEWSVEGQTSPASLRN